MNHEELTIFPLAGRKRLLELAKLAKLTRNQLSTQEKITPRISNQPASLSFAQQRLWLLEQLDPAANIAYHMPAALRLQGHLDYAALQTTLDRIVARHEVLRTRFALINGEAKQLIAEADCGFTLNQQDLSSLTSIERQVAIKEFIIAEASNPFDLAQGPLIRGQLLYLNENEYILLLTQHHIISDGWSIGVLVHEFSTLYSAFSQGSSDPLPELAIQYSDYAVWQRAWLQGERFERQLAYWRQTLLGAPALLTLPTDRPRPVKQSYASGQVTLSWPPELDAELRTLSQRYGATLFMTLLTGWSVLLARLSGQQDIVVGTPISNRQQQELEPLIGFFVNTLALRVQLFDNPSVGELLTRVKMHALEAYEHQDLPFDKLVEALQPPRNLGHNPVFQVMLALDNTPRDTRLQLPGLHISQLELERKATPFDLSISFTETEQGLSGCLEYAKDLFDAASIQRLAGYLENVFVAMVADENQRVLELPLLSTRESEQILVGFNVTTETCPQDSLIHQLFEQQVELAPESVALRYGDEELSYGELNCRANQLAHHLIKLGLSPDDRVAICVERSLEMVVGLLGILKAGGAYVPLDPNYPIERLNYMLVDSQPMVVLTQSKLLGVLPKVSVPVLPLDIEQQVFPNQMIHNPDAVILGLKPSHLAYVIYTSGSTGQPKGVMNTHSGLSNLASVQAESFNVIAESRVLQFASFSFDASVSEWVMTLCRGASLYLVAREDLLPGEPLTQTLCRHQISHVTLPPSALYFLDAAVLPEALTLIVAGEACSASLASQWTSQYRFFNAYGPSEATVCASIYEYQTQQLDSLPIGRPIANTQIYILDSYNQPVPIGVAGELHIGGAGVARGYLNRPELTAERFIADPFSNKAGARLYKTGDLGRWLPDGNIEYLGRNDFQVKIRGFRIELGEIEARLAACDGVREAVVVAREDAPGDKRLVAYLVPQAGMVLDAATLRAELSTSLADYMLPGAFVVLEALPLTPNGKLDRQALPAPDQDAVVTRQYEAPQGEIEQQLAQIWQDLLGVEHIGRHDNFFELGGHSLLIVSVIERLRLMNLHLDVGTVFAEPTLMAMAARVSKEENIAGEGVPENRIPRDTQAITPEMLPLIMLSQPEIDSIVTDVAGGAANIQDIYPLGPLQQGILFHYLLGAKGDPYLSYTIMAFDSRQRLDGFLTALQQVIDRHDILRSAVHWKGLPEPVQVVWRQAPLRVEELSLLAGEDAEQQLYQHIDPQWARLDVTRAPLMSASITQDSQSDEWLLALLSHHLVCDHLTLELMLHEIQIFIQQQEERLPHPLPYRNFIAQARSVPQTVHEAYFRQQLGDVDESTAPFGLLDVQGTGTLVVETRGYVETRLAQAVRDCARREGVSAAVLFHVAWAQVMAQCSGRDDVVFGTVLLGRSQGVAGADQVLGMFMNTLPVRVRLGKRSVWQVMRETYQHLSELLTHEQAPLSLAQRCSGVQAPLPLFNSLLNYRHSPGGADQQSVWEGIRWISGEERTNYPLSLDIDDSGQGFELTVQSRGEVAPERIMAYVETALKGIVTALCSAPDTLIQQVDILPASEREQILTDFNATTVAYPSDRLPHQLFEQQVARAPEAIALRYGDEELSYDELNCQANRLAHHLISLGVCPDDRVALCATRSSEMVVGLLAILKAGGAYVPLDPNYPPERLSYMLVDSAPVVVVTQSNLLEMLPELSVPVLVLDETKVQSMLATQSMHNPSAEILGLNPSHLAYVIYTSGSTGLPKGVMIEHRGLVNYSLDAIRQFELTAADSVLQQNSLNFDLSLEEMLPTLLAGASLVLARDLFGSSSQRESCDDTVSVVHLTAAHWHSLVGQWSEVPARALRDLHGVRLLNVTGDALSVQKLQAWAEIRPAHTHLINTYGPTEATVSCTATRLSDGARSVTIGKPFANTRMYILDVHGQLAPVSVAGELYIGGVQVGRGYLNRPELTAERFIADPFSNKAGARLYKTGDLGRWLPDGNIEYLGRNDFQVKIRGFRIELGEIEARLAACDGVREAVVVAREDAPGDKRLVAYLVPQAGMVLDAATLRAELSTSLADYMLPGAFVGLEALPLTPNGKLDRQALPAPDQSAVVTRQYEAPQGKLEQQLAQIWQDLLGVEHIGRHDNFFELGGHSLLIVSVIERLRLMNLHLDVAAVFARPTLMAMATRVSTGESIAGEGVPENRIPGDTQVITPEMLPLIMLSQPEIDSIVTDVAGGAANIQDIYPLGPLQQGILFHHLLENEGDTYLERSMLAFDSRQRLDGFLAALQRVIDRHDILRSAVHWKGLPEPVQVVWRQAPLRVEELSLLAGEDAERQLYQHTDPRRVRLDVTRAPLMSATIVQDPQSGEWLLALLFHHLVCDHVSLELINNEVQAFLQQQEEHLPHPLPYRNFIAQARSVPQTVHEAYFRQQLGDVDESTAPFGLLDVQGEGTLVVETRGYVETRLAQAVRDCARREGVSAAVLFHVAWAQVMAQCSGRDDVVFGTVLLGRSQGVAGADQVLGMFMNTLPVRVRLGERSVWQVMRETYQHLSELLAHEQAPLSLAQRCSGVQAPMPLFNSLLNYRHSPGGADQQSVWEGIRWISTEERTNYPLSLDIDDSGQGFELTVQSRGEVAPERIMAYVETALKGIVTALCSAPDTLIQQVDILPASEREQILTDFNATTVAYPSDRLPHQLFEQQVARAPEAIALRYGDEELSYDELNCQANRLAHHLISLGVCPDDRVALCATRSSEMVVGLLAILKAGGAYVPLDPNYPPERLSYMLADSAPVVVVTQSNLLEMLPELSVPVLVLDETKVQSMLATQSMHNPSAEILGLNPSHLAYVIYTSGSTGLPKGVMVEHRNVAHLIYAQLRMTGLTHSDRVLQFASFGFDASIGEIFPTFAAGALLVLRPEYLMVPDAAFIAFLQHHNITVVDLPTAFWHQWVREISLGRCLLNSSLRSVTVGGEKAEYHQLMQWLASPSTKECRWLNTYGPTETTVHVLTIAFDQDTSFTQREVPIGSPIANTQIYILDSYNQPVPIGVAGELHIGGAGVARGYLNRPELTAERFIADPFSDEPAARLYKTSDLGRWLPDGNIEYLGRNDFQVKIRGFRIELGEIEARLAACDGVREAVVVAREDAPGDKRLVAYLVPQAGMVLDAAALRAELSTSLAEYMLPGAFVVLEALPLTPNGKLDRQALPAPDQRAVVTRQYEAPQGKLEQQLAQIWQDLLGVERIGRHDNFFELGGHSLLIVSVIERLRLMNLHLNVAAVFAGPTLMAMATRVSTGESIAGEGVPENRIPGDTQVITPEMLPLIMLSQPEIDSIVAGVTDGAANIQDIYPLGPLQQGILFHHLLENEGDTYLERAMLAFDSRQRLDGFLTALQRVIDRHDILRSAVHWKGLLEPVQVVWRQAPLWIEELNLSAEEDAERQLYQHTDPRRVRLDVTRAPLMSATIAQDPQSGEWLLALLLHHLVCDHVSLELINNEVQAFLQQQEEHLPLPLPYRNFIAQARSVPQTVHEAYFRQQLGDVDESTAPFGLLDVQGTGTLVVETRGYVETRLAQAVRDCARREGVSAAVLFHVAWAQVMAQCSGRDDVVFGTVLLGRSQGVAGADQVLGMFMNTLPVRVRLGKRSVWQVMRETYQHLSELLTHEQAPLSLAQRCSGVQAPLPLFNSLLNYRHSPGGADQQSVWEGIRWISGEERTNYPLSLDIDDSGQGFELTVQSRGEVAPERIMAYVETALKGIVTALCSAPDTLIQQVDILPASEREQILTDFNATTVAYPSDRLPHQLFEQQVARAPEAIALRYGDEELSYDELNCQANRLAHHLISLGVCPDDRVALCATRSSEMVVGLLAILKAGGAYVPLDPNYPPERLSYMLADSAPVVVVTQSNLLEMLPELSVPVLVLDETKVQSMLATQSMHNPSAEILGLNPSHLAYVIYTSGSTGLPKGVMIEHRGLVNYSLDAIRQFELTAADSVLQQNSLNFDLSLEEMLPTLLAGASLVLARDLFGSSSQCESCDDTVSVVHLTAAHWHSLVGQWSEVPARALRDLHGVRLLNVTGDALSVQKLQAWAEIRPAHTHLINTYGPTEATVSCTATRLSDGARSVTIGKPFANTRMYILDVHGQLAPVSVAGELYIGGVQVGRGYLNRPELTAERFIADPFSDEPAARLYKTGDLGRWLPDGNIEYLGRNDFQVKIRGFRIELGEIEARLAACDGVREAVVVAREDAPGDKRLVAYLVPQAGMGLDAATLRAELSTSLADYMLPGAFVVLEALPLTPNGKLDRQALPAPDQSAVVTRQYEAPQGKLEQQLAQIWQDLLGVERIGRHDNFFELGGHSLLAMSLVARLRQSLDTEIVLGDIFTEKTISQLAISIQSDCNSNQYPNLFPIRTGGKDIPLFFVHAGGGSISYAYDLVTWMDDISIPVYGFSAGNLLEKEAKDGSLVTIQMLAESYIKGMLHVQPVGPYRIAAWSSGGVIAYEMARQLIAAGKKMDFIGLIDTDRDYKQFYPEYEKPNGFVFDEMAKLIEVLSTLDIPNVVINKSIELAKNKDYTAVLQLVKENSNVKSLPEYSFLKDFLLVCHNMDVASYHYCPPKLPTMITLFSAMDENDRSDFSLGWGNLIFDGLLRIVPLRGTHSSIMKKPYISHLGKELLRIIKTKGKSG